MMESGRNLNLQEKDILNKVLSGEISIRKVAMFVEDWESAIKIRRLAIEELAGVEFENIQNYSIDTENVVKKIPRI